jgi:hypothetical protein
VAAAAYKKGHPLDVTSLGDGLAQLEDLNVLGAFFEENLWGELRDDERKLLTSHLVAPADVTTTAATSASDRATLAALGLLKGDRIPISLFERWLRDVKVVPVH